MIKQSILVAYCLISLAVPLLAGCATNPSSNQKPTNASSGTTREQMQGAAEEAASQPLRDIGLMKKKIPYALARIADPYAEPTGPGCAWLTYELTQLSAALGAEVAIMPVADRSSTTERGSRMATDAARDFIRSSGSRLLPGRSVIRRLSGASTSDELYKAAKERGMVRRGYLKGLSEARSCNT